MELKPVTYKPGASQMLFAMGYKADMNPTTALGEIWDNGLDRGAHNQTAAFDRQRRTANFVDDGKGTTDVDAIVTPFKHKEHGDPDEIVAGRFGLGGTAALLWLTEALGSCRVRSVTSHFISETQADFAAMRQSDEFQGATGQEPNDGQSTGTSIFATNVRSFQSQEFSAASRILGFRFTPALRKGRVLKLNGNSLSAYEPPESFKRVNFKIEVEGTTVKVRFHFVKPGTSNQGKGFNVIFGHRIVSTYTDPIGNRSLDPSRIYCEVELDSRHWKNINDHKTGFSAYPQELMDNLSESCALLFQEIETREEFIEFKDLFENVQSKLDELTGHGTAGHKEKRQSPRILDEDSHGRGTGERNRENFRLVQPGNNTGQKHKRIILSKTDDPEVPFEVKSEGKMIRYVFSTSHPLNRVYFQPGASEYLYHHIILGIACDRYICPFKYRSLFPRYEPQKLGLDFASLLSDTLSPAQVNDLVGEAI